MLLSTKSISHRCGICALIVGRLQTNYWFLAVLSPREILPFCLGVMNAHQFAPDFIDRLLLQHLQRCGPVSSWRSQFLPIDSISRRYGVHTLMNGRLQTIYRFSAKLGPREILPICLGVIECLPICS